MKSSVPAPFQASSAASGAIFALNFIPSRAVQPANALFPILVIVFGNVT